MRRLAAFAAVLVGICCAPGTAVADVCPGVSSGSCPYTSVQGVGNRGEGVFRFPQALAVGPPPGSQVYVGDQWSHLIQRFDSLGTYLDEFGTPGGGAGQFTSSVGAIAVDPSTSNVFVADSADSPSRVEEFSSTGSYIASFSGTVDGKALKFGGGHANDAGAGGALAVGGGLLYVGDTSNDRIVTFPLSNPSAAPTLFATPGNTLNNPKGLAYTPAGLYVADDDNNRVLLLDATSGAQIAVDSFPNGDTLRNPYGVAVTGDGEVFVADNLDNRIVRFSPGLVAETAWGGMAFPRAIATDGQNPGLVYVTDVSGNQIQAYDENGLLKFKWGFSGRGQGQFTDPAGARSDPSGSTAIAQPIDFRIEVLDGTGKYQTSYGRAQLFTGAGPGAQPDTLLTPMGVGVDPGRDWIVADSGNTRLARFNYFGTALSPFSGATGQPSDVVSDGAGNLYAADPSQNRIDVFNSAGAFAGSFDDSASGTALSGPQSLAFDPAGNLVVADTGNNRIVRFTTAGAELNVYGTTGTTQLGHFEGPTGVAVDAAGNIYVADRGNYRVQRIPAGEASSPDPTGVVAWGARGTSDGFFEHPHGIAVDCNGTVIVSDEDNNRVERFTPAPLVTSPCAPVPTPPPPPAPTTTATTAAAPPPPPPAPVITVKKLRISRVLSHRSLTVRVVCSQPCALTASGTTTPTAQPPKHVKRFTAKLAAVSARLAANVPRTLTLTIAKASVKSLVKRLPHKRKGLKTTLVVAANGIGGKAKTVTLHFTATR